MIVPGYTSTAIAARVSRIFQLALLLALPVFGGCGGTSTDAPVTQDTPPTQDVVCVPTDPSTAAACGTALISFTDADGDFLSYSVDVLSLKLERADGTIVETLPNSTRVDFANYVDLTEFVSAANLPPGHYIAGSIRLDYSNAEIIVESAGEAVAATVVDTTGTAIVETELRIVLPENAGLMLTRGMTSLLTVDFDLAASHTVDISVTPALVTTEPFIVAELDPVQQKEMRARGTLAAFDATAMEYSVGLMPFHHMGGDFGNLTVHIDTNTEFEIDGVPYLGAAGMDALAAMDIGTMTVAQGTLNVAERSFTAALVLVGSSVPGQDFDAVMGTVVSRVGDTMQMIGATVIGRNQEPFFHDHVQVMIGPDTRVFQNGQHDVALGIDAISVGQRVLFMGNATISDTGVSLDAMNGGSRLYPTRLSGQVTNVMSGQLDVALHAINGRHVQMFDFSGTGLSPSVDADPANYEIGTGSMMGGMMGGMMGDTASATPGDAVVVYGYPEAFGAATPDFAGHTMMNFMDMTSAETDSNLGIGWGLSGTTAPFVSMGVEGLVIDNSNGQIDLRHHIKQGSVVIDLLALESGVLISPTTEVRRLYAIRSQDSLQLYHDFDAFVTALTTALDGATTMRSMYASGQYDADSNTITARKIGVHLLQP